MKIAILTPNKSTYTETFIQNHIKYLPFEKVVIYGDRLPYITDKIKPSKKSVLMHKACEKIMRLFNLKIASYKEKQLKKILIKEKVDLVFAEYLITGAEVVNLCKRLNKPIMAIALGYEISVYEVVNKYKNKYKLLFDYADAIFIVSNHMKQNILELGCEPSKLYFSPIGPHADFFKIKPDYHSNQLVAIGRFVEKKAPYLTILAFNKILQVYPAAKLVMAGDGPLLGVCKDLVDALEINNSVQFLGRINQEEQKELFSKSFLFIQHSKKASNGDMEGTPVAILEASAAGLPIISTVHAGIPDVVIHNKSGLLSKELDIQTMALNIMEMLKDKPMASTFGQNGKEYVLEKYSLQKHIDIIEDKIIKALKI